MYTIQYKNEEDLFEFETVAIHPFQAMKIWQDATACLGQCSIISFKKNEYAVRLF